MFGIHDRKHGESSIESDSDSKSPTVSMFSTVYTMIQEDSESDVPATPHNGTSNLVSLNISV